MPLPKAQDDELVMGLVEMALASPPDRRRGCLEQACGADSELFDAVWTYVQAEQQMDGFLLDPLYPPLEDDHPFEPGQILDGRFRIVREVAQGGMGIVYEAVDERLERRIALKCAKTGFRRRLPPEVRHAREVTHPNVCRIFEIHTARTDRGEIDFLTMEFLEGETLAEKVRRGPLPHEEARTIALQLCAGLAEAHRKQVIHGDFKSSNIIVMAEADGAVRAVITDFGLARRPEGPRTMTHSGELGGTPDYMAPELWKGDKPSVASDIYALGVILRELAHGAHGRDASSAPSPHAKWDRIVRRATDPDPRRRYRDAEEAARALAPRSRRWFIGAAAAALLAIASGLATYQTTTAPQQQVRLAVLPLDSRPETATIAANASRDAARQLAAVKSSARTKFTVVPMTRVLAKKVDTAEQARAAFGASHVLHGSVQAADGRVGLQVFLTDTRSAVRLKEWKVTYAPAEVRLMPAALAGFVTGTFHLPALTELAKVNAPAREDYNRGLYYLRRDSTVDAALPLLERAAAADPDSPLTHAALGEGYWLKYLVSNDRLWLQRSEESLRDSERRNLDLPEVHCIAGLHKAKAGWYEQAEAAYLRAIEIQPLNGDAHRRLGMAYDANDEPDKALAALRRAVELEPGNHRNHQALGSFYHKHRADYREAVKHFAKAADLAPEEPVAHFALGSVYRSLGLFSDAERELRKALALGETPAVLNVLGNVLMYQGREQEAVKYFSRALSWWPEEYLLWMNLGQAYRRLNLRAEAERANRRALELVEAAMAKNPRSGYVRACLAYLCAWLGERRRAESEIAQALQLSPNDHDARRMAVKTYEALGRREDSLAVLSASPPDVRADVGRYPDLADLHRDPRFQAMLVGIQNK